MPCAAGELCAVQELTPVAQRCAMKGWGGAQVEGFVTPVVMQFKRIVSYSSSDVYGTTTFNSNTFSYFPDDFLVFRLFRATHMRMSRSAERWPS